MNRWKVADLPRGGFGEWWVLLIGNVLTLPVLLYLWAVTGFWLVAVSAVTGGALIAALIWLRIRYGEEYKSHWN